MLGKNQVKWYTYRGQYRAWDLGELFSVKDAELNEMIQCYATAENNQVVRDHIDIKGHGIKT